MFMEAYGAGLIKKLAKEHDVIVVSPFTNMFAGADGPALFDRMLGMLSGEHPVDGRRIYLVGHSMGAGVVGRLVAECADKIAGAVCLCGFKGFGESVKITAPSRIEPLVRSLPVEYRFVVGYGHTLVVAWDLPAIFEWLLRC